MVMLMRRCALLIALLLATWAALAQPTPGTAPFTQHGQLFTASGTFKVPAFVSTVFVDGCGAGGGNGLGQASANTAGGGGGGGGFCCVNLPQNVLPGASLTVTVGQGVANGTGGNTTVTGTQTNTVPTMSGGAAGLIGGGVTPGVGGVGGAGAGALGGAGGGAAGTIGNSPTLRTLYCNNAAGGGGGASTSATAGAGALGLGTFPGGAPGSGNDAGGGGGPSLFGNGGVGGTNGNPGATPTIGFGGGAGGNGTNSSTTVAGANGFVLIRW